jgi:hypothetical protein
MQGFVLDPNPDNFEYTDFIRGSIDQAICTCTDFILSVAILSLLYFKNRDTIRQVHHARTIKNDNMCSVIRCRALSSIVTNPEG